MTYIKINKSSLDYHHFSDFHVFTMNNLVRNVMQKGKYKKAVKIVRLGLLLGLKTLYKKFRMKDAKIARTYYRLHRTYFLPKTKDKIEKSFLNKNKKFESKEVVENTDIDIESEPSESFSKYSEKLKYIYEKDGNFIATNELPPEDKTTYQYNVLKALNFKKIYSKKPHTFYYGVRDLSVFDMVVQVYTMLTGAWYMRKSKVSGRTILIPSPLRPYRRITNVTKMLLKGIRRRRREERYKKNAMVDSMSQEFYWLVLYNGIQYTPLATMIDNSYVWNAKNDSHKELVANLKNIKHLKYF